MTSPVIQKFTPCPILYDANAVIALDKPEGLLTHPNPGHEAGDKKAVFSGAYDFESRSFEIPGARIWLIHRLDQDTSGVLLAARSGAMAAKLRLLFEEDKIRKGYTALVSGRVTPPKGAWQDALVSQKKGSKIRSRIMPSGRPNARLRYTVKGSYPRQALSLLSIDLITGKTHQIRVQAAWRRHPVAGDEIYGNFSLNREWKKTLNLRRLFLHASTLEFKHPATEEAIRIESPLPEKLQSVLTYLENSRR